MPFCAGDGSHCSQIALLHYISLLLTKDLKITGLALSKSPHDISSYSAKYNYIRETQCHQVPAVITASLKEAGTEREPQRVLC